MPLLASSPIPVLALLWVWLTDVARSCFHRVQKGAVEAQEQQCAGEKGCVSESHPLEAITQCSGYLSIPCHRWLPCSLLLPLAM